MNMTIKKKHHTNYYKSQHQKQQVYKAINSLPKRQLPSTK